MRLRLLGNCLCLVLFCLSTTPSHAESAPGGAESPCTPGELLFAPSYIPLDLIPTPDGRSLLVVDRGVLALRDVSTLKVQRYLLPRVDGWQSATLSQDGRTLTAQTFDGQRYAFDTTTWEARRLQDVRVLKAEREQADYVGLEGLGGTKFMGREAYSKLREVLRAPGLVEKLTTAEDAPLAVVVDAARQQLLISGATGSLTLVDLKGQRVLKRVPCKGCSPYVALSADADGYLGVTDQGMLRVLDRKLKVVREAALLPPEPSAKGEPDPRLVRRAVRVADGSRVAWLTRDGELGLFDLGTGTHVARLPSVGLGGTDLAALLDARRLAVLHEGTVHIWDIPEQRLLLEKKGPYADAVRLDAEQLLATRWDGFAELISSRSGEVLRSLCVTQRGCKRGGPKDLKSLIARYNEHAQKGEEREAGLLAEEIVDLQDPEGAELLVSPDRRTLVAVSYPSLERGRWAPGSIGTWRLPGLEPLGVRPLTREEADGWARFDADGGLYAGDQALSVAGLPAPVARKAPDPDPRAPDKEQKDVRVYSGGGLTIRVEPGRYSEDRYDDVELLGPGERPLGILSTFDVHFRRWPLRHAAVADVLPSGERFVISSQAGMKETPLPPGFAPLGSTQVWCSPKEQPLPLFPEAPPLPAVMESGGLTEVSLAGVPMYYEAIAATQDGVAWLLAGARLSRDSAPSATPTLWRLKPLNPEAERLELPPGSEEWSRLATAPDDGSLWALGKGALAHREADGQWTLHALPAAAAPSRELRAPEFLALPGGRAVVMRSFNEEPGLRLQFIFAGPGPALEVTEYKGAGELLPLVPLPDGFLFLGTRSSIHPVTGPTTPASLLVPGFRFREGKRLEEDVLLSRVRELLPEAVWGRQGRVLLVSGQPSKNRESWPWVELDARTGKVLKQHPSSQLLSTAVGVPDKASAPARQGHPRPELLDHRGRALVVPQWAHPDWLRGGSEPQEVVSTPKGTWVRLRDDVLLFWDGAKLSAYFHPQTRDYALRYAN